MPPRYPFLEFSIGSTFFHLNFQVQPPPSVLHGCSQTHCLLCQTTSSLIRVSANGIDFILVSLIWNTGISFAWLDFFFALNTQTTPKCFHFFQDTLSSIFPFPSPFFCFFYSLFSHPFFPQSESYLEFKVLVRSQLHQKIHIPKVHISWISSFPKPWEQNHVSGGKNTGFGSQRPTFKVWFYQSLPPLPLFLCGSLFPRTHAIAHSGHKEWIRSWGFLLFMLREHKLKKKKYK